MVRVQGRLLRGSNDAFLRCIGKSFFNQVLLLSGSNNPVRPVQNVVLGSRVLGRFPLLV
jgi:hypothetical protein